MNTQVSLNLFDVLVIVVIFQYLLIATFLFFHRPSRPSANYFLAIFFVLIAVNLADGLAMMKGFFLRFPNLALIEDSLVLTYGPILFFYTRQIIDPKRTLSVTDGWHLVPYLSLLVASLVAFHTRSHDDQLRIVHAIMNQDLPAFEGVLISSLLFVHFFSYVAVCLLKLRRHHGLLEQQFSSLQEVNLRWLEFTLTTIAICFGVSYLATVFSLQGSTQWSAAAMVVVLATLLYYIGAFVLRSLKDPRLFAASTIDEEVLRPTSRTLEASEKEVITQKLRLAIERDHLHLQAGITVDGLAAKMEVPPRKVSQYLNDVLGRSFFDYINHLRIEEAQRILRDSDDPKLTVQEVMYQVGFSSKSSFNTIFRQATGMTPTAYRRNQVSR